MAKVEIMISYMRVVLKKSFNKGTLA